MNQVIGDRTREVSELEMQQRSAVMVVEQYEKESRRADAERQLLATQLDKLDKELIQVKYNSLFLNITIVSKLVQTCSDLSGLV